MFYKVWVFPSCQVFDTFTACIRWGGTFKSSLRRQQLAQFAIDAVPPCTPNYSNTMCPLRYILLLLSLLVAMIGLSQAMTDQEVSALTEDGEDEKSGGKGKKQQSTFRTLVDMLNGKYLYDAYKLSRGTAAIKAD
ncbi:hypothetical protein L917_11331 [Phytophthora nicotianae]|uniref:Uncharacterized protein n=1 Tax=Phytophthora nicotianae TaxID=4792 RepID=W2KXF5_PHYNI|nr:hypothetical protein L917_11331 [Phytophthora nicotianae]